MNTRELHHETMTDTALRNIFEQQYLRDLIGVWGELPKDSQEVALLAYQAFRAGFQFITGSTVEPS